MQPQSPDGPANPAATVDEGALPAGGRPPDDEAADRLLMQGLRRGEERALTQTYARYRTRIYTFLVRLCGRRDLADDLLQETFLQLARHATRLAEDTKLAAWLFTVARNRHRSQQRTLRFRLERLRGWFEGRAADLPGRDGRLADSPHGRLTQRQDFAQLEAAIQTLSPPLREVILLVGVEDMDQDQAAQVLSITPAALRQRLSRARTQLASSLEAGENGRGVSPRADVPPSSPRRGNTDGHP